MDKAVLEVGLRRSAKETSVQRVLSVEESPLAAGENYASDVSRIRLKVVLGNGRTTLRKLFLKSSLKNKKGELLKEFQVFKTEITMYTIVFREMEYLMNEFEDIDEPLWCKLVHYEPYTSVLLEDLEGCGYRLVDRRVGMDLVHGLVAVRALGRYHAYMKVLEARGIISKNDTRSYAGADRQLVKAINYPALYNAIKGIMKHWGPEWNKIGDQLLLPFEKYMEMVEKSLKVEEGEFQLLNHGDCWSNNIMFKYDWRERPISVRFLDFQGCHYHTNCMDLSNFVFFSLRPSVRRLHYRSLLENYHESLISTLNKYNYEGHRPGLEETTDVMERVELYWTYVFIVWYPMVTSESKDTFDIQKLVETKGEEGFNSDIFGEATVKERLSPDLIKLVEKYFSVST